jgi:ribosomal protein S6
VKNYECLFIIEPDAASERFDQVKTTIAQDIERFEGSVGEAEELGQRTLSYPIRHCHEGFYYLLNFSIDPVALQEIRARYTLNSDILRYLITARG